MNNESLNLLRHEITSKLRSQLDHYDLEELQTLAREYVLSKPASFVPENVEPVKAYPKIAKDGAVRLYNKAELLGRALVRRGKVGALLVAGGQGTRLGFDGPKGEFPVTPIKHKPLFQVFAEQLRAYSKENNTIIPWYIMTNPDNFVETKSFFKKNNFFGYSEKDIFFFEQNMIPAFAMDGSLLLSDKDTIALSPNGHGGCIRAIKDSGAIDDMHHRGIEHLSYFQVDNPLVHCIDYTFIGLHAITESEMSSKVVPKAKALERVGNFVVADNKVRVIEYSDMPQELAEQTNSDGSLRFNAGSIAVHVLSVSFIKRLNSEKNIKLPWHRAEKKVSCIDENGKHIEPETPNAIKLEQFIFDAIPLAKNALVYETDRNEEFSPVKNAEGNDSPKTCLTDQVARASRWLRDAHVHVSDRGVVLEIDPLFAVSSYQLKERIKTLGIRMIPDNAVVYFGIRGIEGLALDIRALTQQKGWWKRFLAILKAPFSFKRKESSAKIA